MLADAYGSILVAGTRDCTLQRSYQKLVEEAPAPFLSDGQRSQLERCAAAICREAGYVNAGTVEFLLSPAGELSFLEVSTRLQVEHSATEETVGMPSSSASTPRTRTSGSPRPPGRSPGSGRRAARGSGWTPGSKPAA